MCNPARRFPAPATCKAGGWSRQQRPFRPRCPVPLRPMPLPAATSSVGLSLYRSCAPLPAVASSVARLRATPPSIPSAALPRPPCRSPCGYRRRPRGGLLRAPAAPRCRSSPQAFGRLTMLNLVKVARRSRGLPSVKIAYGELLKCAAPRRRFRRSSTAPPPLLRFRSAWRFCGISISLPPNF